MILKQSFDSIHCFDQIVIGLNVFWFAIFLFFFFFKYTHLFFSLFSLFLLHSFSSLLFLHYYFFLTGDISEMAKTQLFAWEAYNKGEDAAHLQANPTQVELARKQFHSTKEKMLAAKKKKRLEKYGGQEHLTQQSHQERFGEESRYVEYDQRGNVVKGYEKAAPKSKYVEDQHPHGHTSVWVSKKEISNYECISWKVHYYLIIFCHFF